MIALSQSVMIRVSQDSTKKDLSNQESLNVLLEGQYLGLQL